MRIWSLHPKYLDSKGIVALWREALLAKHVLENKSKGYSNHPQLIRFKSNKDPIACINYYLSIVYEESLKRGYHFDRNKIPDRIFPCIMKVTKGQMEYETSHLLKKLLIRNPVQYQPLFNLKNIEQHPIFQIVDGPIEEWELIS
jgi:hypothetical protein